MCKPKKPKPVEIPDPVYVRNDYLDGSFSPLNSQRSGRSSLRLPLGGGLAIPRGPGAGAAPRGPGANPQAHAADIARRIVRAF